MTDSTKADWVAPAFWLSWYSPAALGQWELHSPWWVSGERMDGTQIIVAAVRAEDEEAAWDAVRLAYDEPPESIEPRFIEPMDEGESPFSGRFPQYGWMAWEPGGRTCRCEARHAR